MLRWNELDPKVLASLIVGLLTYAVTKLGLAWDPKLEQLVNVIAMVVAGYATPNHTDNPPAGEGDDTIHAKDPLNK